MLMSISVFLMTDIELFNSPRSIHVAVKLLKIGMHAN
jgi:hypothetical protein